METDIPMQFQPRPEEQPLLPKPASQPPSTTPSTTTPSPIFGYLFMLLSATCHATMTVLLRLGSTHHAFPPVSSALTRSIVSTPLSLLYIFLLSDFRKTFTALSPTSYLILSIRGFCGASGVFSLIKALSLIPVGNAVTIFFSSPAITTLLCAIFLAERATAVDILATIACFVGVLLVSNPSFLHPTVAHLSRQSAIGSFYALLAAIFASIGYVIVRRMRVRVHFMLNVSAFGMSMGVLAGLFARKGDVAEIFSNRTGMLLNLAAAVAGFGSQSFLNLSLQTCRAGPAVVIRTASVPLAYLMGMVVLGEHASIATMVGVLLVMSAGGAIAVCAALDKEAQVGSGERGRNGCS